MCRSISVAVFFGFKVGDVTISPVSIIIAIGIFALAFAAFHAVLQWMDSKLLPRMNFDLGLRNSIRTSLGYISFLIAAGRRPHAISGWNFESSRLSLALCRSASVSVCSRLSTISSRA
jgi:Small-conductance mechanosensitive channel